MKMRKQMALGLCLMLLAALIPMMAAADTLPLDFSPGLTPLPGSFLNDMEYRDDSIHVLIQTGREYGTDYWVARVKIMDPTQMRTASAAGFDSQRVMNGRALAGRMQAVLAINGDYFSYIHDGYLVRQGQMYRDLPGGMRDVLLVDDKGDFHIALRADQQVLAPYKDMTIVNSFNFGPALVVNGERVLRFWNYQNAADKSRQRMAIAQMKTGSLEYLAVASAGPKGDNSGLTLDQFSRILAGLGIETAYNLDGGDSTMMIFNGEYINAIHAATMRPISDIIYFATTQKE